jgi:hypothetical protein
MIDRGFQNDMQSLPIICSHCNWTDILQNYQVIHLFTSPYFVTFYSSLSQEHLDQAHPNPQCDYCHEQFTSINQLNQHQASQCQKITIDCFLKTFGCHQQVHIFLFDEIHMYIYYVVMFRLFDVNYQIIILVNNIKSQYSMLFNK